MISRPTRRQKGGGTRSIDRLPPNQRAETQLPLPPPFAYEGKDAPGPPRILTIGHSTHEPRHFLALLHQHGVRTLVDVRSAPYSRYAPHFNRDSLDALLDDAGIRYVWAGDALGGRPDDPACYRDGIARKGRVDYLAVAQRPWYQEGVTRLLETARRSTTAIMCGEEEPRRCHRHRLIESTLRERGAEVAHIRRDGAVETIVQGEDAPPDAPSPQLALIGLDI